VQALLEETSQRPTDVELVTDVAKIQALVQEINS
jgi:hypothetical protein